MRPEHQLAQAKVKAHGVAPAGRWDGARYGTSAVSDTSTACRPSDADALCFWPAD